MSILFRNSVVFAILGAEDDLKKVTDIAYKQV